MIDQLIIGDKASFDDFEASLASRKIKKPAKKSIKETVPFSNVTYDFSAINGEVYWEERELEYVFEIMADDPEQLEEKKRKFAAWVMGVMEQDIHDPFIPDYHFKGTYDDMEEDDDEGLDKSTVTVTFTAYPYMIANLPTRYERTMTPLSFEMLCIENKSSHPVAATIQSSGHVTYDINSADDNIELNAHEVHSVFLRSGLSTISIVSREENDEITTVIEFTEEVF